MRGENKRKTSFVCIVLITRGIWILFEQWVGLGDRLKHFKTMANCYGILTKIKEIQELFSFHWCSIVQGYKLKWKPPTLCP